VRDLARTRSFMWLPAIGPARDAVRFTPRPWSSATIIHRACARPGRDAVALASRSRTRRISTVPRPVFKQPQLPHLFRRAVPTAVRCAPADSTGARSNSFQDGSKRADAATLCRSYQGARIQRIDHITASPPTMTLRCASYDILKAPRVEFASPEYTPRRYLHVRS